MFEKLRKKKEPKENPVSLPKVDPTPPPGSSAITPADLTDTTSKGVYTAEVKVNQTGYRNHGMKFRGYLNIYHTLNGRKRLVHSTSGMGGDADAVFEELQKEARDWMAAQKKVDSGVYNREFTL